MEIIVLVKVNIIWYNVFGEINENKFFNTIM